MCGRFLDTDPVALLELAHHVRIDRLDEDPEHEPKDQRADGDHRLSRQDQRDRGQDARATEPGEESPRKTASAPNRHVGARALGGV